MEVITIEHPQTFHPDDFPPLSIALGFFDGIHKGHQAVIGTAVRKAEAKGIKSAVMTFDPHPSEVLGNSKGPVRYITPLSDKIAILEGMGIDYLFIIHFTKEFASLQPEEFTEKYLVSLHAVHVTAGFDYSYGKFGKGSMATLERDAKGRFETTTVEKLEQGEEKVSSTRLRGLLKEGAVREFTALAGRRCTLRGRVVDGEKRGRQLGFPTANIEPDPQYIIPAPGVYAVRILVGGSWYNGVCNVGYKPTFHDIRPEHPSVEVHILGFSGDIYGEQAVIEWWNRIRSERKFSGLEELVRQIGADKEETASYFASLGE